MSKPLFAHVKSNSCTFRESRFLVSPARGEREREEGEGEGEREGGREGT